MIHLPENQSQPSEGNRAFSRTERLALSLVTGVVGAIGATVVADVVHDVYESITDMHFEIETDRILGGTR